MVDTVLSHRSSRSRSVQARGVPPHPRRLGAAGFSNVASTSSRLASRQAARSERLAAVWSGWSVSRPSSPAAAVVIKHRAWWHYGMVLLIASGIVGLSMWLPFVGYALATALSALAFVRRVPAQTMALLAVVLFGLIIALLVLNLHHFSEVIATHAYLLLVWTAATLLRSTTPASGNFQL